MNITQNDRAILREHAKKQLEYANSPVMRKRIQEWYEHNDLRGKRPMVQIEMWTFGDQVIPQRLQCETPDARGIENGFLYNYLNHELFDDDYPVPDFFPIGWRLNFKLFGIDVQAEHAKDDTGKETLGYRFKYPINDLQEDLPKLGKTEYGVDREGTLKYKEELEDLFGDILPVRITSGSLYAGLTYHVVQLMGLENMMLSMYDYPDEFHELMARIEQSFGEYFDWLEGEGLQLPTDGYNGVGQGTWGFTRELPKGKSWGYMDSQESSSLSPDMYGEFIYPYMKKIAERYGLLSYGCCEAVDPVWDKYVSKYNNIRKVSISPWCNEEYMGERLQGGNTIYHRKPSPNFVGVGSVFDEGGYKAHIAKTLRAAKGCKLEFTLRDIYSINHDVNRARRAIEIIRQQTEEIW